MATGNNALAEAFLRIGVDDKKVAQGLDKTEKKTRTLASEFDKLAARAKIAFAAIAAAIAGATAKFGQFEKSMLTVKAIMQDRLTGEEFIKLERLARDMGATTAFTAAQAADALTTLARAGNSAGQQMELLPKTLALAAAGQIEIAESADIMSRVIKGMQLNTSQAADVIDVLAAAANSANTDIRELGAAFAKIGPVGAAQGRSLRELAAATQVLAEGGFRGGEGGNALRRIFTRLIAPTGEAKRIMEEFNIKVADAQGNLRPLADIVDSVNQAFANLTPEQEAYNTTMIAGQHAQAQFNVLLAAGGNALRINEKALGQVEGTAQRMLEALLGGTAGKWAEFKSAVESASLSIGKTFAPAINALLEALTAAARALSNFIENNAGIIKLATMATGALAAKSAIVALAAAIKSLGLLAMAGGPLTITIAAMTSLVAATEMGRDAVAQFVRIFNNLGNGMEFHAAIEASKNAPNKRIEADAEMQQAVNAAVMAGLKAEREGPSDPKPRKMVIEDFDPRAIEKFKFEEQFKAIRENDRKQRLGRNEGRLISGLDAQANMEARLRRLTARIGTESRSQGPLQISSASGFSRSLISAMGGTDNKMIALLQQQKNTEEKQLQEQIESNKKLGALIEKDGGARFEGGGNPEE